MGAAVNAPRTRYEPRLPIVPQLRCADPKCGRILFQREEPWHGDPIFIQCRRCGQMNRASVDGVWIVAQAGDVQPISR